MCATDDDNVDNALANLTLSIVIDHLSDGDDGDDTHTILHSQTHDRTTEIRQIVSPSDMLIIPAHAMPAAVAICGCARVAVRLQFGRMLRRRQTVDDAGGAVDAGEPASIFTFDYNHDYAVCVCVCLCFWCPHSETHTSNRSDTHAAHS